jgi:chemotaxis protein MotB
MAAEKKAKGKGGSLVIRKNIIVEGGGHHGGAWKVAYADFVTAMMAFFLLMWLLNATTEQQRRGIADYFSPANLFAQSVSGSGKPFGGLTPTEHGLMVSDTGVVQVTQGTHPSTPEQTQSDTVETAARQDNTDGSADASNVNGAQTASQPGTDSGMAPGGQPKEAGAGQAVRARDNATALNDLGKTYVASLSASGGQSPQKQQGQQQTQQQMSEAQFQAEQARHEKQAFEQAAKEIRQAIQADPKLAELGRQLAIDMTPEGLRIQIMDAEKRAMFATGSAVMDDSARLLLAKVAPVLMKMPEDIAIAGHTDAAPYPGPERTNWDLSADRANATRRLLMEAGLPESRIRSVTGNAERDPLIPNDPLAPGNRRISIVVLRNAPVAPAGSTGPVPVVPAAAPTAATPAVTAPAATAPAAAAPAPAAPAPTPARAAPAAK